MKNYSLINVCIPIFCVGNFLPNLRFDPKLPKVSLQIANRSKQPVNRLHNIHIPMS